MSSNERAVVERLKVLQARHDQLLAMLPGDLNKLAELDDDQLGATFSDVELIATEMVATCKQMQTVFDELKER